MNKHAILYKLLKVFSVLLFLKFFKKGYPMIITSTRQCTGDDSIKNLRIIGAQIPLVVEAYFLWYSIACTYPYRCIVTNG